MMMLQTKFVSVVVMEKVDNHYFEREIVMRCVVLIQLHSVVQALKIQLKYVMKILKNLYIHEHVMYEMQQNEIEHTLWIKMVRFIGHVRLMMEDGKIVIVRLKMFIQETVKNQKRTESVHEAILVMGHNSQREVMNDLMV